MNERRLREMCIRVSSASFTVPYSRRPPVHTAARWTPLDAGSLQAQHVYCYYFRRDCASGEGTTTSPGTRSRTSTSLARSEEARPGRRQRRRRSLQRLHIPFEIDLSDGRWYDDKEMLVWNYAKGAIAFVWAWRPSRSASRSFYRLRNGPLWTSASSAALTGQTTSHSHGLQVLQRLH